MTDQNSSITTSPLHWFPLATQQLRLRSLSHVFLYHPTCQGGHEETDINQYYLTFHETALSSPFYTSMQARQVEDRVSWPDLEQKMGEEWGGVRGVIVRLWCKKGEEEASTSMAVWGVNFSGLVCVGDKISRACINNLQANSVVFKLHQHFFVFNDCLTNRIQQTKFMEVPFMTVDSCKASYDKSTLSRLAGILRALKQNSCSNSRIKREIAGRGLEPGQGVAIVPPLQTATLRQQIFSVQPKHPHTKMAEIQLATKIEDIKFRIDLLRKERDRLRMVVVNKKEEQEKRVMDGDECNTKLMENYHTLSKDKEKLETWMQTFQESRDCSNKTAEALKLRRNQLISQLSEIFPILDTSSHLPTICHVALPISEAQAMRERDDTDLSVGLGWSAHLTVMVSSLLGVPLRYPTTSGGSRSAIEDQILDRIPDKEREFPLYAKGVERVRFEYGVYLLNKNIAQLRWYCGENTPDLRPTLSNLSGLLTICSNSVAGEVEFQPTSTNSSPARFQLPVAPPVLAGVARQGAALVSANSPARRFSSAEKEDSSSEGEVKPTIGVEESDPDKTVKSDINELKEIVEQSESVCENNGQDIQETDKNQCVQELSENKSVINDISSSDDRTVDHSNGVIEEQMELDTETVEGVEEAVEATDVFWDSVASRTLALATPHSFKTHLGRSYK